MTTSCPRPWWRRLRWARLLSLMLAVTTLACAYGWWNCHRLLCDAQQTAREAIAETIKAVDVAEDWQRIANERQTVAPVGAAMPPPER